MVGPNLNKQAYGDFSPSSETQQQVGENLNYNVALQELRLPRSYFVII